MEKINLLVTGGCGFIGSNFINHILTKSEKYNIINIDALYYCAEKTIDWKKFKVQKIIN